MKINDCNKMMVKMKNILAEKHLPVNKITLSFEDAFLNNEFTQGLAQRSVKVVRFSMLFALIIYVVFGFILDDMIPDTNVFYIVNRIIGISLSIIILTLTYLPVFKNYSQAISFSLIIIGGLNIVTMAVDSGGELYVGLILTSIYAHSLLRLRFVFATVTTWFLVAAYLILISTIKLAPLELIVNNAFFLISGNMVGMVASYSIEYFMRSAFWKSHIVKVKSRELEEEYERKSLELESARQIQLAMLPQEQIIPDIDLSVIMKTASEIGGDYYDYHLAEDNTLTFAIGDVTGHGAKAGAMVTAMKILFSNYAPDLEITEFLKKANKSIRQLKLPMLYMAFAIGRIRNSQLEIAGVGLPSLIIHRSLTGMIEKVELKGLPLGSVDENNFEKKIFQPKSW
jgi:F0F1-type ATP synthase assembly protein I